jgi:parallel beta helix pectate lyase-like protein/pectate lyase-like protein
MSPCETLAAVFQVRGALVGLLSSAVVACGGSGSAPAAKTPTVKDDTAAVQAAIDQGGVVHFSAGTYHLTRTITIRHSGTVIVGAGPSTVFEYQPSQQLQHCENDRVFTTPCMLYAQMPRAIAASISAGDTSFLATTADDVADLQPGDWLLINEYDSVLRDRVAVDWVQVETVSGLQVRVAQPFRMPFSAALPFVAKKSGLGFEPIPVIENVELRNFKVLVDNVPSPNTGGIAIFGALNSTVDGVTVENYNGQPLYCYLSKGVTITNSAGVGGAVLSEFASSVDVTISGNHFSSTAGPGMGLDLGLGFFTVSGNSVGQSANAGIYLLYGVHDGSVRNNQVAQVGTTVQGGSATGLMIWGSRNVAVSDNYLAGGMGPASIGVSIRSYTGEAFEPDTGVVLSGNAIGDFVTAVQMK